jgi:hypothetical protein
LQPRARWTSCMMLTASGSQPRQPPYEATFLEGFLGLIKVLIQRVPTKIPTKLPRRRRSVRRPYAQSPAALWSSIVSDQATKLARSLSVGKVFLKLVRYAPVDCRCRGASSSSRRKLADDGMKGSNRFFVASILKLALAGHLLLAIRNHVSEILATLHSPTGRCDRSTDCSTTA